MSNARETWCVILVSESWHILLRITAHLHFVPVGAKPLSPRQCAPSRSGYLSRSLNSHWERFVITHHLQKWESQLRLRWICFWATSASKNFALYQFGSTKNAVLTKLSIQHFLFIWYIPSKLHTGEILASFIQSRVLGQALKRLVTVSSMCYHTSTSALSTSYSSRVFTSLKEWDISSWGGLHA